MKPTPKREIVIPKEAPEWCILSIYVSSPDARQWIEAVAPVYGNLIPLWDIDGCASLHVNPCFDVEEVRQYLESQGQE
jgi:hypothetical protein